MILCIARGLFYLGSWLCACEFGKVREVNSGQEPTGSGRLDRIERGLELLLDDRVQFREEHKHLLAAQVLLTGSLDRLMDRVDRLTERVDRLTEGVDRLTADVGLMRENFDIRLKRLEH